MKNKYSFGIDNSNKNQKIVVITESKWLKGKRTYELNPTQELKAIFNYYNYEEVVYDESNYIASKGEFINESELKNNEEIIASLSHSPLLVYNEDLSKLLSLYVHCLIKDLSDSSYILTLYIEKVIDWNMKLRGDIENEYINDFLTDIGFKNIHKSSPMLIYTIEVPISDISEKTIKEITNKIRKNKNIQSDTGFNDTTLVYHRRIIKPKGLDIESKII